MHVNGFVLLVFIVAGKTNSVSVTGNMNSSFVLPPIVFDERYSHVRVTFEIQAQHPLISSTEYMIALGGEGMSAFNLSLNEGFDLNISTKETEFKTITRNAVYLIELVSIIENDTLDNWLEDEKIAINVRYGTLAPMTVYPISSLGKDYKAITYCQILGKCFIILSTLPATTVEVKVALPETSKSSRKIELTFNATKYGSGETILFALSGNYTAIIECACDLTGTFISSNGTIAVFAGGRDTVVRWGNKEKTFITQLLPLNTWGKEFILIDSDIDDFGDTIRVISRYNNTVVKMNGYKTVTMHAMSHFIIQRSLQRGSTLHLSSSKPTMVCQIVADGFKQPTMINIPPAEHFFNTELSIPCTFCNHLKLITNGYNDSIKIKGGGMTQFKLVSKSGFTVMHFDHEYMFDNNYICVIQSKNIPFALLYTNMSSNRYMKFHYIGSTGIQTKSQPEDEDGNGTNEDICIDLTDTSSHGKCFVVPVLPIWKDGYCQLAISPKRNDTEQINYINGEVMEPNETSNGEEMTVIKITTEDKSSINFLWYNNEAKQAISTLLFPIDVFGLEYYAASYCPQSAYCVSYCIITAIYDNTHVKVLFEDIHYIINITEFGISDYSVDNTSRINLAIGKYKYALVKSERDLTGTYIWADNRVSVICGANFNNTAVAEQLYPVQFFKSGSYSYILRHDEDSVANYNIRIMTSAWVTSCRLTISESLTFFEWEIYLDKPGHYEQIAKGEIDYIEDISCDQPVFVWVTVINNVGSGFMVIIPSTDHIMDTYNFKTFQNLNGNASEHKLYGYVSNIDTTSVLSSFKVNPYTIDRNFDHNRSILLRPDTSYRVNFDNNTHDHVLWYAGSYNGIAFGSCVGMKFSEVENCILHETEDTDCDGLIHEDICTLAGYNFAPPKHLLFSDRYIADYDLDGNYDEDCAFTLPECYAPNIKNGGSEDIPQSYTHVTSKLSNLYCNSGYTAEVDVESITCEADGIWKPNYICQKDCTDPDTFYKNSYIKHNTSWAAGGNVTMGCDDGYTLTGGGVIFCQRDSQWQKDIFLCAKDCTDPVTLYTNSYIKQNTSWAAGGNVTMSCDDGYTLFGYNVIFCQNNSKWQEDIFSCAEECTDPETFYNNSYIKQNTSWAAGGNVTMGCDDGYTLIGDDVIFCENDSQWQKDIFLCAKDCIDPQTFYNNSYIKQNTSWAAGGNVTPDCDDGYTLIGDAVIFCENNSQWQKDIFLCAKDCIDPQTFYNNSYIKQNTSWAPGGNVTMGCDGGYTLIGYNVIFCQNNSNWQGNIFSCTQGCIDPRLSSEHSYIVNYQEGTLFQYGMTIKLQCDSGTTLTPKWSYGEITCENSGNWSHQIKCIPDCPDPRTAIQVPHAMVRGFTDQSSKTFGVSYEFRCKVFYTMYGDGRIECLANSTWSEIKFQCKTCKCPCRKRGNPRYEYVTDEVVHKIKDETEKELAVQKKLTSTHVRKRKSAKDDRPVAKSIGVFGIFFITLVVAAVVASDYIILRRHFMQLFTNLTNIVRRMRR